MFSKSLNSFSKIKPTLGSTSSCISKANYCQDIKKPIAIILSGTGLWDGSELTEVASLFIALSKRKIAFECYSVDKNHAHVLNHRTGETETNRNVLEESSRITRQPVFSVNKLLHKTEHMVSGIIVPGGFGVAKHLCGYHAEESKSMYMNPYMNVLIREARYKSIPQAFCGFSSVLAAKALHGIKLTVGNNNESEEWPFAKAASVINDLESNHINTNATEVCIDEENLIVSTPGHLYKGTPATIFKGMENLTDNLIKLVKSL